jgi:hypothetical protein
MWYRLHERSLPPPLTWGVKLPESNSTFREIGIAPNAHRILRCSQGSNSSWHDSDGTAWQVIFLEWDPGRSAARLARNHTPEVCLTSAGRRVLAQTEVRHYEAGGLSLPVRSYTVTDPGGLIYVFYCLWDDRVGTRDFGTELLDYGNRLRPVLAGRRNSGQRSLEVAIAGVGDQAQAEGLFARKLSELVQRL